MSGLSAQKPVIGRAVRDIAAPAAAAFDFVAKHFFENYPRWCPQVVAVAPIGDGSMRVGARGRQITLESGIETASTFEVAVYEPHQRFELLGVSDPFRIEYGFDTAHEQTTCVAFTIELTELDFAMRPFRKLISRALTEGAEATVQNIKALVEREPTSASA